MTYRRRNSLLTDHGPARPGCTNGQTTTEYAVILVLIFGLVMAVLPFLASSVTGLFTQIATSFGG